MKLAARSYRTFAQKKLIDNQIFISNEQLLTLRYLVENKESNLSQVATNFKKDKAAITRIVSELEKRKLLQKNEKKSDKRNFNLKVTEKGMSVVVKSIAVMMEIQQHGRRDISDEEMIAFEKTLQKINKNLLIS